MRIAAAVAILMLAAHPVAAQEGRPPIAPSRNPVIPGNNVFAVDLYVRLARTEGNLFFSPYSVSAAMALAILGAGSGTGDEIRRVMHYPEFDTNLHAGMAQLVKSLNARAELDSVDLQIANAVWVDDSLSVTKRYQTHLQRFYGMGIERASFAGAPERARATINEWVADQTHDKIEDLMPPGSVTRETQLVIANAIYFRAPWAHTFPEDDTETAAFTRADGKHVDVPMMHQTREFPYVETDTYQAVELPYVNDQLAMLVLLPRNGHDVATVEDALAGEPIDSLIARLEPGAYLVDTFLPRFRIEQSTSLNDVLMAMGMPGAFRPGADFPGFSQDADLYISSVVHKAYVDVTEEGTEAAAATGITVGAIRVSQPKAPVTFRADHPFVFLIRDRATRAILFMGRVMDPTA